MIFRKYSEVEKLAFLNFAKCEFIFFFVFTDFYKSFNFLSIFYLSYLKSIQKNSILFNF